MTVLIDTNVILDILLQRQHFAVQYTAGEHIQADYIITRDPGGYEDSSISVIQPADFLTLMEQKTG